MESAAPPRSRYHHGDLPNALLREGIALLHEGGREALSLRALAQRVGVSHTAPKNHFGSLRGLLTAIAAEGFRRHAAAMRADLPDAPTRTEALRAATRGYVRFAMDEPHLFDLMFSEEECDVAGPELQAAAAESRGLLTEISRGARWTNLAGDTAPATTETMLWSIVHGLAQLGRMGMLPGAPDDLPDLDTILPAITYET